jgi:glycosyltransferase involved in cell wall biosynthesis
MAPRIVSRWTLAVQEHLLAAGSFVEVIYRPLRFFDSFGRLIMIYLEVTTSCKSVRNTGIQRITRKLFHELAARGPITPISWNKVGRRFQRLSRGQLATLKTPFQGQSYPTGRPELRGENLVADAYRLIFRRTLRLQHEMGPDDVFLMPDIYRDARTRFFRNLLAQIAGRSVAIFHDAAELQLPSLYARAGPGFRNYIESLSAFDLVVCVSHSSHEHLQQLWAQFGATPTKTAVEPWPIEFAPAERNCATRASRNLIVCVGSLEPRKNHLALLREAEALWRRGIQFSLQLIGRGDDIFGGRVTRQIRRLQKNGYPIQWLRHVPEGILHRAYRECRFTVYPSLAEGFGLPILESLWHGKPCVCGGNGALGEAALGGGCLIVDQTSRGAIAAGIEKLLNDQETYQRLCREARARTFRSWSDYTDRLLSHLQMLRGKRTMMLAES